MKAYSAQAPVRQLSPEVESALEDIWAHFTMLGGKAPKSFDTIVQELRKSCAAKVQIGVSESSAMTSM